MEIKIGCAVEGYLVGKEPMFTSGTVLSILEKTVVVLYDELETGVMKKCDLQILNNV